jgi:hypothetical protein
VAVTAVSRASCSFCVVAAMAWASDCVAIAFGKLAESGEDSCQSILKNPKCFVHVKLWQNFLYVWLKHKHVIYSDTDI